MLPLRDLYGTFMVFLLGLLHCFLLVCRWPSDVGVTSYFRFFLQQRYSSDDLFDKATKDINKKVVFITLFYISKKLNCISNFGMEWFGI